MYGGAITEILRVDQNHPLLYGLILLGGASSRLYVHYSNIVNLPLLKMKIIFLTASKIGSGVAQSVFYKVCMLHNSHLDSELNIIVLLETTSKLWKERGIRGPFL